MHGTLSFSDPLLAIIGPSACGKSTVVRELVSRGVLHITPSWTTRPRRDDERHGAAEHRFVDERQFAELRAQGFFLETVQPFGLPWSYGIPRVERGMAAAMPTVMLRAPLLGLLGAHYAAPLVYQIEADFEQSLRRLAARSGDVGSRAEQWISERDLGRDLAHRIFFNDGSVDQIATQFMRALRNDVRVAA